MQPRVDDAGNAPEAVISTEKDSNRYLLFNLGSELYGCRLTQVREVIKVGVIKPVPYMVPYFKGVINLRGKIIGVVDLTQKLNLKSSNEHRLILITETAKGLLGVIVDDVVAVEEVEAQDVSKETSTDSRIAPEFFDGVGRIRERLVHLVRLADIAAEQDYRVA